MAWERVVVEVVVVVVVVTKGEGRPGSRHSHASARPTLSALSGHKVTLLL